MYKPSPSKVDDAAFTPAVDEVMPIGALFDDVSPDSVNEGDVGIPRMSANRNAYVTVRDAAGNERGLNIDASGAAAVISNAGTNLNTSALALESGGNLAAIKAKTDNIPAQGQALAAASLPVVLTAAQMTTLTPIAGALEATLQSVKTAVEIIDNFISGTKGLVTEDNSAAIKTAVELIDNAVSGAGFNITQQGGVAVSLNTGVRDSGTQRVTIATNDVVPITDNGGSLTIDAPIGTPVNVQIGNATLAMGVVDETGASAVDAGAVGGGTPHDSVDSGNPVKIGFKAISALPAVVAANDRVNGVSDLFGRQLISHIDPAMQIWKSYNDTSSRGAGSAQILWTPAGGKKIAITSITISTYGTTSARMFLFFAANADLTYTAGTDQPVFVGSFSPSATVKPGMVFSPSVPIIANTADYKLLYQNDAALSVDIVVHGYEI